MVGGVSSAVRNTRVSREKELSFRSSMTVCIVKRIYSYSGNPPSGFKVKEILSEDVIVKSIDSPVPTFSNRKQSSEFELVISELSECRICSEKVNSIFAVVGISS